MAHMIIGIHGLSNKPAPDALEDGWRNAILEGLRRNCKNTEQKIEFKSVYWADVLYEKPMQQNEEPYLTAPGDGPLKTYEDSWWDDMVAGVLEVGGSTLDAAKRLLGIRRIADKVLEGKLPDLFRYYDEPMIKATLRDRLQKVLLDVKDNTRMMLIAHSMGSIVAYDVLRDIGKGAPNFQLDHFVTIGSPLGLPHVKYKIAQENHLARTPTVVRKWTNFADRRDPVSLDVHLAGDYASNDRGVEVRDDLVINSYVGRTSKPNYHKSYGYLRAPEVSKAIRAFI